MVRPSKKKVPPAKEKVDVSHRLDSLEKKLGDLLQIVQQNVEKNAAPPPPVIQEVSHKASRKRKATPSAAAGSAAQLDKEVVAVSPKKAAPSSPVTRQRHHGELFHDDGSLSLDRHAVSLALDQVLGGSANNEGDVLSSFLLAGSVVEPRIRAKILNREYIDLGTLIPRNESSQGLNIACAQGYTSQISLTPSRPRQPPNIFEWANWFSTFASIYTQKYEHEAPQLFTYIQRIFGLSRTYQGVFVWRVYDEKFRRLKQFSVSLPWHILDQNILHEALTVSTSQAKNNSNPQTKKPQNQGQNQNSRPGERTGYCYSFNKTSGCPRPVNNCQYKHQCSKCSRGAHPAYRCTSTDVAKPRTQGAPARQ